MNHSTRTFCVSSVVLGFALAISPAARGADDVASLKQEIEQLRQEVQALRAIVENQGAAAKATRASDTAADVAGAQSVGAGNASVTPSQSGRDQVAAVTHELAAQPNSGVNLAGYGHIGIARGQQDPIKGSAFNEVGFNPIFHYQYKDRLLFETELEIMSNGAGEADFGLEYANLNLFVNDRITLFGGKFLSPVGYFIQNLHPAWINKFPSKPVGFEEEVGAVPVSDVGMGVRGALQLGGAKANYALYLGNGPRLELSPAGDEIESIVATGANSNPSGRKLLGGRFGIRPTPRLEVGVSAASSNVAVADDTSGVVEPTRSYSVAGADFAYKQQSWDVRGEYILSTVGDLASSVAPFGGTWKAWYLQGAYRIPGSKWEPALRIGDFTSPHADQSQKQRAIAFDYWFEPNIVAKFAYELNSGLVSTANDANRLLLQFGYGF
jgi:hypothetical protein